MGNASGWGGRIRRERALSVSSARWLCRRCRDSLSDSCIGESAAGVISICAPGPTHAGQLAAPSRAGADPAGSAIRGLNRGRQAPTRHERRRGLGDYFVEPGLQRECEGGKRGLHTRRKIEIRGPGPDELTLQDEGSARLTHRGAQPIERDQGSQTRRWREADSNHRSRCCKRLCWALPIGTSARSVEPPKVRSEIARIDLGGPPMAVPFPAGPMVRIRFPPPGSHEQIEPSGELTTGANRLAAVSDRRTD